MMPRQTMQVVKSVRISLTMDDIIDNMGQLTKQQIIQKFRLLLDKKQIQINQKIQKNNAQHLLVLQKKMLILEKKDDQIVKLTNSISTYKNQLHQEKIKNNDLADQLLETKLKSNHFQKKYTQFDTIFKQQKAKREKLKKQHQKLTAQFKQLFDNHTVEVMGHKKVKDQKTQWKQQTQFLLNNLKKNHQTQLQSKITTLTLTYENKIVEYQQALQEEKKKYENYKQRYLQSKKTIHTLNRVIQILNKQLQTQKVKNKKQAKQLFEVETQTDEIQDNDKDLNFLRTQTNKSILSLPIVKTQTLQQEVQAQIKIECQQCIALKTQIQNLESQLKIFKPKQFKKVQKARTLPYGVQVSPPPPPPRQEIFTQTIFQSLSAQQQMQLIGAFRRIKYTSENLIEHWKNKYEYIQSLFQNRPSKVEDRKKISELETLRIKNQLQIIQKQRKIQSLQFLIQELHNRNIEKNALLDQFDMQQVQIKSFNKSLQFKPENFQQSTFNKSNFGNARILKSHKDKRSLTCTSRQFKNKNRSFSLNANERANNLSVTIYSKKVQQTDENQRKCDILKHKEETQNSQKNQNKLKLNHMLLQRGIVFKQKAKKQGQQISQIRKYKKYKSSLKKMQY